MQVRLVYGKLAKFACPKEIASYLAMTRGGGVGGNVANLHSSLVLKRLLRSSQ
jgi:hypothetical protein